MFLAPGSVVTCFTFYIHLWPTSWLSLVVTQNLNKSTCLLHRRHVIRQAYTICGKERMGWILNRLLWKFPCRMQVTCISQGLPNGRLQDCSLTSDAHHVTSGHYYYYWNNTCNYEQMNLSQCSQVWEVTVQEETKISGRDFEIMYTCCSNHPLSRVVKVSEQLSLG
jgi:hypothetical protein